MENVCGKMTNYGKTTNEQGEASVIKTQSEPGMPMSLKNMEISGSIGKGVKSAVSSHIPGACLAPSFPPPP